MLFNRMKLKKCFGILFRRKNEKKNKSKKSIKTKLKQFSQKKFYGKTFIFAKPFTTTAKWERKRQKLHKLQLLLFL